MGKRGPQPKGYVETMARLLPGTLERIWEVLEEKESQAQFMRLAIEKELKRRESHQRAV